MKNKITFFLMGQKGLESLKKFIETFGSCFIDCIICARDEKLQKDYYDEIAGLCKKNSIKFFDRKRNINIHSKYSFAIAWRWMIRDPQKNLIVLHDSMLPKYRGYAPLVNSLINGETTIGVTAIFANADFDKGDVIERKSIKIKYPIKIEEAIKIISKCYGQLVVEISRLIISGKKIYSYPQNEKKSSYCLWLNEDDFMISWNSDAAYIKRFIDSVGYPYNGASSFIHKRMVRILDAEVVRDVKIENRVPGKVLFIDKGYPIIVCKKGLLKLKKVIDNETSEGIIPLSKWRVRFQ